MKKPSVHISQPVPLNNQSGGILMQEIDLIVNAYTTACKRAGVEPVDVLPVLTGRIKSKNPKPIF